jgi:hypothetical protein
MITCLEDRSDDPHQETRRHLLLCRHGVKNKSKERGDKVLPDLIEGVLHCPVGDPP